MSPYGRMDQISSIEKSDISIENLSNFSIINETIISEPNLVETIVPSIIYLNKYDAICYTDVGTQPLISNNANLLIIIDNGRENITISNVRSYTTTNSSEICVKKILGKKHKIMFQSDDKFMNDWYNEDFKNYTIDLKLETRLRKSDLYRFVELSLSFFYIGLFGVACNQIYKFLKE